MINQGILNQSAFHSPLLEASFIKPRGGVWKRNMASELLLTALVDAFSILVIFLLMSFSSAGDILFIGKNTELPLARLTEVLERNPVIKVEEGKIFFENKEVTNEGLIQGLIEMKQNFSAERSGQEFPGIVTVQADRRVKYDFLNQIVLACAHAGFSDIRFAVIAK